MTDAAFLLGGVLRRYDWGSTTLLPRLLGEEPDGRPAAELWFGAHADDPSPVDDSTLDALVGYDPIAMLGADVAARFDAQLPFLLKILAAGRALSMQVHPDRGQAQAGFAAENAAGVPRNARERNYRDPNHKPELLCALTPFDALCGFRPVGATLALLDELALPELGFLAELLHGPDPLRAAFTALLTHADPGPFVAAVVARAAGAVDGPLRAVRLAAEHFPEDVGVVLALLLNDVRLEPGEAIYLGAGNVHSYLRGMGVEVMANSDNVLRCGLTPKHVDVPELLKITDFRELAEPRWSCVGGAFDVPVPDFRLVRVAGELTGDVPGGGPRIVLCIEGTVGVGELELRPGRAAFVPAAAGAVSLRGAGLAFVAGVGR